MKTVFKLFILLNAIVIVSSCQNEEIYNEDMAVGLWKQVSVTEDGQPVTLKPEQQNCQLLIEQNGVCRIYHQTFNNYNNGNGPTNFFGTWSLTDGKWLNITTDKWQFITAISTDSAKIKLDYKKVVIAPGDTITVIDTLKNVKKQWSKFHIQSRFTIVQLSENQMEIRLKTFVGEKKYAFIFAPDSDDFVELKPVDAGAVNYSPKLVTNENFWTIRKEFQTLKTYVFKFERKTY